MILIRHKSLSEEGIDYLKQRYFTDKTIAEKSRLILEEASRYSPPNAIQFLPSRAALIIIDMQNVFLQSDSSSYIPSAPAILPAIKQLQNRFLLMPRPVLFTRHLNTEQDAKMMSKWWNGFIREKSISSEIAANFDCSSAKVLRKSQYDAFFETNLEELLKDQDVSQIVICGVTTHLCCESTARSAFMRGFEVFLVVDGTATFNEAFHRAAVINLAHGFAKPILTENILAAMKI